MAEHGVARRRDVAASCVAIHMQASEASIMLINSNVHTLCCRYLALPIFPSFCIYTIWLAELFVTSSALKGEFDLRFMFIKGVAQVVRYLRF